MAKTETDRNREPKGDLLTDLIPNRNHRIIAGLCMGLLLPSVRICIFPTGAVRAMSDLVEFRHLKYIVAIAENSNFTRAAERLFIAQPSLSRQVRDLENEVGFPIFERTREGVRITPSGQMLVDYAQETLNGRTEIIKIAKEVHLGKIAPLRLGFSSFINPKHLQTFRSTYQRLFPNCGVQLSGGDSVHILQRLERGDLDCALLPMPIAGPEWCLQPLTKTPLVVCMRADDPLTQETHVDLETLASRLTIFRDPEGHPSAHARLVQMFAEAGYAVRISCSAATPHDIQLLVREGYGIALVNEDLRLDADVTTRRIRGVEWTADTAFVRHTQADHAALPFIARLFSKRPRPPTHKQPKSERPQLPLKFDFSA
jgi:DNA-binding transcriptional LysR family regulator